MNSDVVSALWWAGVTAVAGAPSVAQALAADSAVAPDRILAVGKAAAAMYCGAYATLAGRGRTLRPGLVVTKSGHVVPELTDCGELEIITAGHPIPDAQSLVAGRRLLQLAGNAGADERWLLLVSGGASALVEALPADMSLVQWQERTAALVASGADIHAINQARREVSQIKGGHLLAAFRGRRVWVLAISDVPGDGIDVIGSGIGDGARLRALRGAVVQARIVASNHRARAAIVAAAGARDLPVCCNEQSLDGELFAVAARLSAQLRAGPPGIYVWGGEPTVELPPTPGRGGRNQALALALVRGLKTIDVSILVAGTDGTDGPTDAAGGYLRSTTPRDYAAVDAALARADAGTYLDAHDELFVTGPTNTNVMDLVICQKHT